LTESGLGRFTDHYSDSEWTIAGFASPNIMMQTNDYASLSSGYSSGMPVAAWCDTFVQPYRRLQASFA